jgi:outer membrane receptor protein involved in Fe transport
LNHFLKQAIAAILIVFGANLNAQVRIKVIDEETGETLFRVIASENKKFVAYSDLDGIIEFGKSQSKERPIKLSLFGYRDTLIQLSSTEQSERLVRLAPNRQTLNTYVVSGNRYIQPLELQSVSIDVIKAEDLNRKFTTNLATAAERISGVNILDGQASIRGGSGYAFGAGSRVLLVVDNQPLITADRNDIKWNYLPLEITDQIEIVKGASSVQYGASALNGVIHLRTIWPDSVPQTRLNLFHSIIPETAGKASAWWGDTLPSQTGMSFAHMQRLPGKVDFVISGNFLQNSSWLNGEYEDRQRMSMKFRRRFGAKKRLTLGLDGTVMHSKSGFFLFWKSDTTEAFLPFAETTKLDFNDLWLNVDPWLNYVDGSNGRHALRMRYYSTHQNAFNGWKPATHLFNGDYQYQRHLIAGINLNAGISGNYFRFYDDGLGGLHSGNFAGIYAQFEKELGRFQLSAGWRYEMFRLDSIISPSIPVQRYGINYRAAKNTYLRSSYGEGFRFPSPAERFVKYKIDIINIYPNPDLQAETGWNAELAVKQKFTKDSWNGYLDLAFFVTSYDNMTEFSFGKWGAQTDPLLGLGFKSINITKALIGGAEFSVFSEGKIAGHDISLVGGYTYVSPVDLSAPDTLQNPADQIQNDSLNQILPFLNYAIQNFDTINTAQSNPVLRYRYRHMIKFNADIGLKNGFSFGGGVRAYSFMEKIDPVLEFFVPGLANYRKDIKKFSAIFDARIGYTFRETTRLSLQVMNVTNSFVTIRPAKPENPRMFILQLNTTLNTQKVKNRVRQIKSRL